MITHSSILAWKIPWTEESGRVQSMGSQRVRHDRVSTHTCLLLFAKKKNTDFIIIIKPVRLCSQLACMPDIHCEKENNLLKGKV